VKRLKGEKVKGIAGITAKSGCFVLGGVGICCDGNKWQKKY
jgi:hypothetical protein